MSANNRTTLHEIDSSLWLNFIRYGIALNALLSNGFLLFLFIKYRQLRTSQCNLLIAANACVEFIVGIGMAVRASFELFAMATELTAFSHALCVWIATPFTGGFAANQVTILALALDRLMAVAQPFRYGQRKKSFICTVFALTITIFILAIGISFWHIDDKTVSNQCSIGINAGPLFSIVWSVYAQASTLLVFGTYTTMLVLFYRQSRMFAKSFDQQNAVAQQQQPTRQPSVSMNAWTMIKREGHNLELQQKKQLKLTFLIALILLIYTLCWSIPTAIWFCFNLLDPNNRARINYISFLMGFLMPCGAGINLYIYLWKHSEIRKYAARTFSRVKSPQ